MATFLKIFLVLLICGLCFAEESKGEAKSKSEVEEPLLSWPSNIKTTLKPVTNETTTVESNVNGTTATTTTEKSLIIPTSTSKPLLNETTIILPVKSNCTLANPTVAAIKPRTKAPRTKRPRVFTSATKKVKPTTTPKPEDEALNGIDNNPFFKLKF